MELKAKFVHDCDTCVLFASDDRGDWYVCNAPNDNRSVICRDGDAPSDYASVPVCVGRTNLLVGALLRGLEMTEIEARRLLVLAWTHEHDLPIEAYRAAPPACDDVVTELRRAVLRKSSVQPSSKD